jgi:hypothetical protein
MGSQRGSEKDKEVEPSGRFLTTRGHGLSAWLLPLRLDAFLDQLEEGITLSQSGFAEDMDAGLQQQHGRYPAIGYPGVAEVAIEGETRPARWAAFLQDHNPDLLCLRPAIHGSDGWQPQNAQGRRPQPQCQSSSPRMVGMTRPPTLTSGEPLAMRARNMTREGRRTS